MTLVAMHLFVAFLGGALARAVRLPPLLGFLAAGFALAAFGVQAEPAVGFLADLGVTLLLFAVGLKLDYRQLIRREVWLTTALHTLIMVIVMVVVGIVFYNNNIWTPKPVVEMPD